MKKKNKLSTDNKNNIEKSKINLEKDSLQYNAQDLKQEQSTDMNPVQLNTQNLHFYVYNDNNYSGKITGTTYAKTNKYIAANADILVFFGNDRSLAVLKTNSDNNGNFIIEDLPPGYYTITSEHQKKLKYQSQYIKVFAGQTTHHPILLK